VADPACRTGDRATPVEIFFDVVFVFTLTQLTGMMEGDFSREGVGRVLLVFGPLWYMYTVMYGSRVTCRPAALHRS
jgi:low temperature requirement protein LtrA